MLAEKTNFYNVSKLNETTKQFATQFYVQVARRCSLVMYWCETKFIIID